MNILTIAVVFRNEEKGILSCLEALALEAKEYKNQIEFLFIDNNSKDNSLKIIQEWKNKNSDLKIRIINRAANHMGLAREQALQESDSRFIAFIDGDCLLVTGWMKGVFNIIEDWKEDTGAFGGTSIYIGEKGWHKFAVSLSGLFPWAKTGGEKQQVSHMPTNNYLVSKEAALSVGGFHALFNRVGEDLDFNVRLSKKYNIYFSPNFQVKHKLPRSYFDWLRKMAFYGRAQSLVLLNNRGGLPVSKFFPLGFVLLSVYFLIMFPLLSQIVLIISLIVPRLRFFVLSFFFYGFGEIVGAVIFLLNHKKVKN